MITITGKNREPIKPYIPENTFGFFTSFFDGYDFDLLIKPPRISKLGDFRVKKNNKYVISVNSDLNKFSFGVTFLHEVAHMIVWHNYGKHANPHGGMWKLEFENLLETFIEFDLPREVRDSIEDYMCDPAASSCSDDNLIRALRKFNTFNGYVHLEDLKEGEKFLLKNGRRFEKGKQLRKRFLCVELHSGLKYRISAVAEVKSVT